MMFVWSSTFLHHCILICQSTWLPLAIIHSDWLKLEKSSLKLVTNYIYLGSYTKIHHFVLIRNFKILLWKLQVQIMYVRSSTKILDPTKTWPPLTIFVSYWLELKSFSSKTYDQNDIIKIKKNSECQQFHQYYLIQMMHVKSPTKVSYFTLLPWKHGRDVNSSLQSYKLVWWILVKLFNLCWSMAILAFAILVWNHRDKLNPNLVGVVHYTNISKQICLPC
jgi:hypothetical protein